MVVNTVSFHREHFVECAFVGVGQGGDRGCSMNTEMLHGVPTGSNTPVMVRRTTVAVSGPCLVASQTGDLAIQLGVA